MAKAARAIIIENGKMLVMQRKKTGPEYYTLVGGRLNGPETPEQAVVREVKEETGLEVIAARLVFTEDHPEPYNFQYIFLCEVAPHDSIKIQETSEEGLMNRIGINIHTPLWVPIDMFGKLPFSTMQLQKAILEALSSGFPETPVAL
jgi:ADP-ribose pyrophosphatase YjhB (NUDIX family)